MQNHNPLKKQTLGKMLDSQTICPASLEQCDKSVQS